MSQVRPSSRSSNRSSSAIRPFSPVNLNSPSSISKKNNDKIVDGFQSPSKLEIPSLKRIIHRRNIVDKENDISCELSADSPNEHYIPKKTISHHKSKIPIRKQSLSPHRSNDKKQKNVAQSKVSISQLLSPMTAVDLNENSKKIPDQTLSNEKDQNIAKQSTDSSEIQQTLFIDAEPAKHAQASSAKDFERSQTVKTDIGNELLRHDDNSDFVLHESAEQNKIDHSAGEINKSFSTEIEYYQNQLDQLNVTILKLETILQNQFQKLKEYENKDNISKAQMNKYQYEIEKMQNETNQRDELYSELLLKNESQNEQLLSKLEVANQQVELLENRIMSLNTELRELQTNTETEKRMAANEDLFRLNNSLAAKEQTIANQIIQINDLKSQLENTQNRLKQCLVTIEKQKETLELRESEFIELNQLIDRLQNELLKMNERFESLSINHSKLENLYKQKSDELLIMKNDYEIELEASQFKLRRYEDSLSQLTEQHHYLNIQYEIIQNQLNELKDSEKSNEYQIKNLLAENQIIIDQKFEIENEIEKLQIENKSLQSKLNEMKTERQFIRSQLKKLTISLTKIEDEKCEVIQQLELLKIKHANELDEIQKYHSDEIEKLNASHDQIEMENDFKLSISIEKQKQLQFQLDETIKQLNQSKSEKYQLQLKIDELNEISKLNQIGTKNELNTLKHQIEAKETVIKDLNGQIQLLKAKAENELKKNETLINEKEIQIAKLNEKLENENSILNQKLSKLQTELIEKSNLLNDSLYQIGHLKEENEYDKKSLNELITNESNSTIFNERLQRSIESLQEEISLKSNELESIRLSKQSTENAQRQMEIEIEDLKTQSKSELSILQNALLSATNEMNLKDDQLAELNLQNKSLNSILKKLQNELRSKEIENEKQLSGLQEDICQLSNRLDKKDQRLQLIENLNNDSTLEFQNEKLRIQLSISLKDQIRLEHLLKQTLIQLNDLRNKNSAQDQMQKSSRSNYSQAQTKIAISESSSALKSVSLIGLGITGLVFIVSVSLATGILQQISAKWQN